MFKIGYEWHSKMHCSLREQKLKLVAVGKILSHKECLKEHFINTKLKLPILFIVYEILGIYQLYYV